MTLTLVIIIVIIYDYYYYFIIMYYYYYCKNNNYKQQQQQVVSLVPIIKNTIFEKNSEIFEKSQNFIIVVNDEDKLSFIEVIIIIII